MKHLQSKWDGQFMQQEHLQKESKWQWYRWLQKMRNIGRSSVADQNQVTENPTTCTLLVQPLATFILQSLPSAVPKLAMGAAMFVLAMLSVCQNRMWGNNLSWYHMTRTSSGEECFSTFFCLPWLLLTVIICTNTFEKADIGWHWYLGSVLAHS